MKLYADNHFEYDQRGYARVEDVAGAGNSKSETPGSGSFLYTYCVTPLGARPGTLDPYNSWVQCVGEQLPDYSTNLIYTNIYGEVMLKGIKDGSKEWDTCYSYDGGRIIMVANPSAIISYSGEPYAGQPYYPDLQVHLKDAQGLIATTEYYQETSANEETAEGVAGYVKEVKVQEGSQGTAIQISNTKYKTHSVRLNTLEAATMVVVASQEVFPNADGSLQQDSSGTDAGPRTTTYSYKWYENPETPSAVPSLQPYMITVTLPTVVASEDGPDTADQTTSVFNRYGQVIWTKDADGYLNYAQYNYTKYDEAIGAVVKTITDVDTNLVIADPKDPGTTRPAQWLEFSPRHDSRGTRYADDGRCSRPDNQSH